MTDPAAFRATYSDWKLIRSRKVVQIVLEVPLEASGQAYDVLGGMPRPDQETWVACARLNEGGAKPSISEPDPSIEEPASAPVPMPARAKFSEKLYANQAGILCNDGKFRRFLAEKDQHPGIEVYDLTMAEDRVREICGVQSRTEIRPGTTAENRWLFLVSAYRAWERAPACGVA